MKISDLEPPQGELTQDRDTFAQELDDGSVVLYHLRIEGDGITFEDIEDPEVFGKVEFVDQLTTTGRPEGFDGSARKLHLGNNHPSRMDIWYQPPEDLKHSSELLKKHVDFVWDVLAWGYTVMIVELEHTLPSGYTNTWRASLGAIEPFPDTKYIAEVADELAAEVTHELKDAHG